MSDLTYDVRVRDSRNSARIRARSSSYRVVWTSPARLWRKTFETKATRCLSRLIAHGHQPRRGVRCRDWDSPVRDTADRVD